MKPGDGEPRDDSFSGFLAAYDEALAAGVPPLPVTPAVAPPGVLPRLQRAQEILQRIEREWPRVSESHPEEEPQSFLAAWLGNASVAGKARLGRFLILRELGRGGGGIVFLAFDPLLRREVALKIPRPEALLTPDLRQRFLREAQAAASLDHPHLVAVYEAGAVGQICYIASAYCAGCTLADWLHEHPEPVSPATAARLTLALADGIAHAHQHGILHRDLKPSNILISPVPASASRCTHDGEARSPAGGEPVPLELGLNFIPRVFDFGLAKLADKRQGATTIGRATRTGALIGTPQYMAPEQAACRHQDIGNHTDIYALGAILYEVLTRQIPFPGNTDFEIMESIRTRQPTKPSALRRDVPPDLETICLKCLQKEPHDRYTEARALARDLRHFLAGRAIEGRCTSRGARLVRWCRRRRLLAGSLVLGSLMVAGAVAFATWHYLDLRGQLRELERTLEQRQELNGMIQELNSNPQVEFGGPTPTVYP
jgi:hypothetical protein